MLRKSLLWMSERKSIFAFVRRNGLARRFASRFVAGETVGEGIAAVAELHQRGIAGTLDLLGEAVTEQAVADQARDAYVEMLRGLAAEEPENPRWQRELGAAFLRSRRLPDAIAALEAAQSTTATVEGERLLADAYAATGRTAEARERQTRYDQAMRQVRLEQLITGEL